MASERATFIINFDFKVGCHGFLLPSKTETEKKIDIEKEMKDNENRTMKKINKIEWILSAMTKCTMHI